MQRWLKFTKYLPGAGYKPVVITPENPDFQFQDPSLLKDVHPDVDVIKLPIWEPYGMFRRLSGNSKVTKQGQALDKKNKSIIDNLAVWVRGNLFLPDPRIFWVKPTVRFLLKFLKGRDQPVLITTGPPHSIHLIGLRLSRKMKIKWIADFRDPWGEWFQFKHLRVSPLIMQAHRRMERKVSQKADKIITVSDAMGSYYDALNPGNVRVIRNGFDPEDFNQDVIRSHPTKFTITHTGTIDDLRQSSPFLKCLQTTVPGGR